MKISSLIFLALMAIRLPVFALDKDWVQAEGKKIDQIIKKFGLPESSLGLYIAGGEDETQVIKSIHGEKKMIPASISKLVTAATVISEFPPGFKFKTSLWSSATQEGGNLKGDLILKGGGDPSFVSETMWYLVNAFNRNQITQVEGDIVIDDSMFDRVRYDSSRQKERVDRAYDAPTGAMSFNWNSVNIFIRPGKKAGDPAIVVVDPENEYIRLRASVSTVGAGGKTSVAADRDEDSKGVGDVLVVTGKIALDSKELVIFKNVTQPDIWAGYNLKAFLKQRGITVKGLIKNGATPATARLLAEAESKPIEDIISDMNKFSNNYVAEMLAKNVAAKMKSPGTIEVGVQLMKRYLQDLGIGTDQAEIYNPSGLTRENKMSAKAFWKVLQHMKTQYAYAPEFMKSLPIAGIDGTLKNRMKSSVGERWVRAKTGFLTGVVSLAGYAGRKDGSVVPFVFIYNGSADESHVRLMFDQIAISLVD